MIETTGQPIEREIHGQAKTIRQILGGGKYSIDYYQREFKWQEKQIKELIDDLTNKFFEDFQTGHPRQAVRGYGHYFLGSIIVSRKKDANYIVDGQQRLTTLTLLLICLRHHLKDPDEIAEINPLILARHYGQKTFNIDVDERREIMTALYERRNYDAAGESESIQNIDAGYEYIEEYLSDELEQEAFPYFKGWFIDNVHLVEITAYTDEDAYTIFETMNDRGLSLRPTEMLKGYLLANIDDTKKRTKANTDWKDRICELRDSSEQGKESDADAFKAWLRSQYADSIRERKKGATPQDWDRIGTEFHRWVRDNRERIGVKDSDSFYHFITQDFDFYSWQYLRLIQASNNLTQGLEHVFYNAQHGFTLQYPILLAPLTPDDSQEAIDLKVKLAAMYVDIMINRRLWNYHSISYNTMQYAMFLVMRDIRRKEPSALATFLCERLSSDPETFRDNPRFALHQMNRKYLQRILARLTDYVETESGMASRYLEYTTGKGSKKYEIEHIWADKPERHRAEFPSATEFRDYRNRIGDLLLLPKSFNGSYGALSYEEKLPLYNAQNLLARSLNPDAYNRNPGFKRFIDRSGLPFQPHLEFNKADVDERQELYIQIAERLWNPQRLVELVK